MHEFINPVGAKLRDILQRTVQPNLSLYHSAWPTRAKTSATTSIVDVFTPTPVCPFVSPSTDEF